MAIATYKGLCIDANDGRRMGSFWGAALGLETRYDDGDDAYLSGSRPEDSVWINVVPEPRTVKQRVHIDVHGRSVDEYEAWGASRLSERDEFPWTVMADPEGVEFCVFVREQLPERRFYELIIDSADTEMIANWWARVFDTRCVADEHGFHWIDGIPGFPADAWAFVPVPEPKTAKNAIHWDLDVPSIDDLLSIGATLLREPDHEISWTILTDPEGNEFCAFKTDP
jgi:hypothetical protein